MKFIGLSKGGLQVLEDIDPNKFRDIKSDFSWIDADKVDTQAMILLKDLYGISSLGNFTTPTIVAQDDYTLIVISYYFELGQRFLPVIVSDKRLMTIHPGLDPVCSEVMASINEMLVSGEFNASTILRGLFAAVIKRDTEHLQAMRNSLRNTELMMRGGVSNVAHIPKFIKESRGVSGSLQETREQIATIALGIADIPGIDEKEVFLMSTTVRTHYPALLASSLRLPQHTRANFCLRCGTSSAKREALL